MLAALQRFNGKFGRDPILPSVARSCWHSLTQPIATFHFSWADFGDEYQAQALYYPRHATFIPSQQSPRGAW